MRLEIWVHQITWVFCALLCFGGPKNLMWFDGPWKPSNHVMFWVHQNTWSFSCVVGPSKHIRFWEGKNLKSLVRVHQITWGFGSIKAHEVLTGEKIDFGPSNHMRFLGPPNQMRWWKMGKIWSGPTKDMSAQKPVSWLGLFSISYSKLALDLHIRFRNSSLNLIKIKTEMWVNQFLRSSK